MASGWDGCWGSKLAILNPDFCKIRMSIGAVWIKSGFPSTQPCDHSTHCRRVCGLVIFTNSAMPCWHLFSCCCRSGWKHTPPAAGHLNRDTMYASNVNTLSPPVMFRSSILSADVCLRLGKHSISNYCPARPTDRGISHADTQFCQYHWPLQPPPLTSPVFSDEGERGGG